ncbi:MAG TPA: hypothetical protein VOA41_08920 [Candidatus Dormibacteraeota bacterium]|nr:hypothetical protein [Candidatus Dormibacteraeota bacterium]
MKVISLFVTVAMLAVLSSAAAAQTSMHTYFCGIDGKEYTSLADLSLSPCNPNRNSNTSSGSNTVSSYGNAGVAFGLWLNQMMTNANRRAEQKKAFEEAARRQLELQQQEAERQHRLEEVAKLNAMIGRLEHSLKLEGLPHLSLKSGDSAGSGYGICGLPGIATGGQRSGCSEAFDSHSNALKLKLGSEATIPQPAANPNSRESANSGQTADATPAATQLSPEQAAALFAQLSPEQQMQILEQMENMQPPAFQTQKSTSGANEPARTEEPRLALKLQGKSPTVQTETPAMQQLKQTSGDSQSATNLTSEEHAAALAGEPFDRGNTAAVDLRRANTTSVDHARVRDGLPLVSAQPAPQKVVAENALTPSQADAPASLKSDTRELKPLDSAGTSSLQTHRGQGTAWGGNNNGAADPQAEQVLESLMRDEPSRAPVRFVSAWSFSQQQRIIKPLLGRQLSEKQMGVIFRMLINMKEFPQVAPSVFGSSMNGVHLRERALVIYENTTLKANYVQKLITAYETLPAASQP